MDDFCHFGSPQIPIYLVRILFPLYCIVVDYCLVNDTDMSRVFPEIIIQFVVQCYFIIEIRQVVPMGSHVFRCA